MRNLLSALGAFAIQCRPSCDKQNNLSLSKSVSVAVVALSEIVHNGSHKLGGDRSYSYLPFSQGRTIGVWRRIN